MSMAISRKDAITAKFRSLYGIQPTCWVRAPGRAELLGTDTDDHLGYVLTMGIHLDTWIAFKPSGTDTVRVHSMNLKRISSMPSVRNRTNPPARGTAMSTGYRARSGSEATRAPAWMPFYTVLFPSVAGCLLLPRSRSRRP